MLNSIPSSKFCALLCGLLLFVCVSSARADQNEEQALFFAALQSGKANELIKLMHPALQKAVDEPVIVAWIATVQKQLGDYQTFQLQTDAQKITQIAAGERSESHAAVAFSKGQASSELVFLEKQLIAFSLTSEKLADNWFRGPQNVDLYRAHAQTFITNILMGKNPQAWELMHPKLQEQLGQEKFSVIINQVMQQMGDPQTIEFQESRFIFASDDRFDRLELTFGFGGGPISGKVDVTYRFAGMKGHLLGFNFQ